MRLSALTAPAGAATAADTAGLAGNKPAAVSKTTAVLMLACTQMRH